MAANANDKKPRHPPTEDGPVVISSSESSSSDDSDFEAEMSNRACDREEAEAAYEKALTKAKADLDRFKQQAEKEADCDRLARALKKRQKAVKAKGKKARKAIAKKSSSCNVAVDQSASDDADLKETQTKDELFALEARKVAKAVMEAMIADGVMDGPVLDAVNADNPPDHRPITHEEELLLACIPEQLRNDGFAAVDLKFPAYEPPQVDGSQVQIAQSMNAIYEGIAAINKKLDHVVRTQQVHTLAHLANLRATGFLRVLCLKDGVKKDKVYSNLMLSLKAVVLGSDPELKELPFRSVPQIEAFFLDINHIIKLAHFLLTFVEFDRFYPTRLLDTVLHIQLQRIVFWKSGTANNGCVSDYFSLLIDMHIG